MKKIVQQVGKRLIRQVGKYIIEMSSEEITEDNFFKHSVWVKIQGKDYNYIQACELSYHMAKVFRYSENEEEISQILKLYIGNLKFRISRVEEIL